MQFEEDSELTYIVLLILNLLSILGCLLILTIYILAKNLRVYAFTLVSYLAIIDILKSSSMLLPTYKESSSNTLCQLQALFLQYFTLASFLMTTMMAVSLYLCVVSNYNNIEKLKLYFLLVTFVIPLIGTLCPYFASTFEKSPTWCSIGNHTSWRFGFFYGPLWVINGLNLVLYTRIIKVLSNNVQSHILRLRLYPLILVLCYTPATIDRALQAMGYGPYYFLTLGSGCGDALLGLINALCYGYTDHVRQFIAQGLCLRSRTSTHEMLVVEELSEKKNRVKVLL